MHLIDHNIVLLFGTTGSGKSTMANSIINGAESMYRDENGLIEIKEFTKMFFKIGHKVVSETKAPTFQNIDGMHDTHLVDGPGINDSNFRDEYAN